MSGVSVGDLDVLALADCSASAAERAAGRIAESGIEHALRALLPALVARAWHPPDRSHAGRDAVAEASERALAELVAGVRPDAWLSLDARGRGFPSWTAVESWNPLAPYWRRWTDLDVASARALSGTTDPPWLADAMLSLHPDGRVREDAVARLASATDPAVLPFLLVRCVDWVRAVRDRAERAALAHVDRAGLDAIGTLPLIRRLSGFQRADARALVAGIEARFAADPDALADRAARSRDPRVRALVIDLLAERDLATTERLEPYLRDRDLAVQARIARIAEEVWARRPDARVSALVARMLRARSARVRAGGLRASIAMLGGDVRSLLVAHLDDPSRRVRWIAKAELLAREPRLDVRGHLVAIVRDAPTYGAIEHLAELRHGPDWELLVPVLDGPRAELARAAIRAMRALDRAASRELRLMMVDDARPGVSQEAARSIAGDLWAADEPIVLGWLASSEPHARQRAVELAPALPGWAGVRVLARVTDPDLDVDRPLSAIVARRYRAGAVLSRADRDALVAALASAPRVSASVRARAVSMLDAMTR